MRDRGLFFWSVTAHTTEEAILATPEAAGTALDHIDCAHRWKVAPPHGPTSRGECSLCGETRDFSNYWEDARINRNRGK